MPSSGSAVCGNASGSGDISETADIPVGDSVTYTITADVLASATGNLDNTATVTAPAGTTDPDGTDNSATDSDTLDAQADLGITKTDGSATYTPGTSLTYTIVVSNTGPADGVGATVTDTFPASLTNVAWTCAVSGSAVCGNASGSGDINETADIPVGDSVTYTVTADVLASATGNLDNTATVAVPAGVTDPDGTDNSATDSDTLDAQADLGITKTDGSATYTPGTSLTYTIVVSNAGPSDVVGATVTDTFPASLTNVAWTCAASGSAICGNASGSNDINETADIPVGDSATYTVTADVLASATGNLDNTATVAVPVGVTDPDGTDNSATDSDTLDAQADLGITKTDGSATYTPGTSLTYTIVVSNAGPADAVGATVTDTFPASLTNVAWTCAVSGSAICGNASGSGDISETADIPVGDSVTYTITADVLASATGNLDNTATVTAPAGTTDPDGTDNSATDSDTLDAQADLGITKTDGSATYTPGTSPDLHHCRQQRWTG